MAPTSGDDGRLGDGAGAAEGPWSAFECGRAFAGTAPGSMPWGAAITLAAGSGPAPAFTFALAPALTPAPALTLAPALGHRSPSWSTVTWPLALTSTTP